MTVDQLIALSASLAAFASATATFLTIRQMARQRETSYRPELVFSSTRFHGAAEFDGGMPKNWNQSDNPPPNAQQRNSLRIPIHNIGLGAAKDITLQWSFDIENITSQVNLLADKAGISATFSLKADILSFKSNELGNGSSMWRNQRNQTFDFLLPASIPLDQISIKLPNAYIQLCSALLHFTTHIQESQNFPDFPVLTALVSFQDLGGSLHQSKHHFSVTLESYIGKGEKFHGTVNCKRDA